MILLDTHAWLWWVQGKGQTNELPETVRALIASAPEPVAVASVSCLEVALLAKKGRISLPVSVEDFFVKAIEGSGLTLLCLTPRIAARSAFLPNIHRDPIDRVLIATALEHDAVLFTKDEAIARYPDVRVRWGA